MLLIKLEENDSVLRGSMISLVTSGDFKNIESFLHKMKTRNVEKVLQKCGEEGVSLLEDATPYDTGMTESSWDYDIESSNGRYKINFYNYNVIDGVNIAIIINYGHATGNGGYVVGYDYIDPAVKEAFDHMADELWREVVKA